jgi:hypothetical protein
VTDLQRDGLARNAASAGGRHHSQNQTVSEGAPSAAAADAAERLAFDALSEMADLAIDYAEALKDAATQGDRLRARLYACQLSRVTRSALLTIADIFAVPRGATA